jgi:hypothetical protein
VGCCSHEWAGTFSARGIHHLRAPSPYGGLMARPKLYDEDRVTTAVRLPASLHRELQSAADERDVSVNFLVIKALRRYMQQLPRGDEIEEPVANLA